MGVEPGSTTPSAAPRAVASQPARRSWVLDLLAVMRREPILFVTLGYVLVSFIGLWASYWFYRRFNLPILEYLQASDFLVAGLRDPAYLSWMAAYALVMWAVSRPMFHWRSDPQRVAEYRKHRWGRLLYPNWIDPSRPRSRFSWSPETALAFGMFWGGIWVLMGYVVAKAEKVARGGGDRVSVTLAGQPQRLAGEARLLGTSSGYVFLYWPDSGRAEAVAGEAIGRIEALPRRKPAVAAKAAR